MPFSLLSRHLMLPSHSTVVAGLADNQSGDERFHNNVFVSGGLAAYDPVKLPVFM